MGAVILTIDVVIQFDLVIIDVSEHVASEWNGDSVGWHALCPLPGVCCLNVGDVNGGAEEAFEPVEIAVIEVIPIGTEYSRMLFDTNESLLKLPHFRK